MEETAALSPSQRLFLSRVETLKACCLEEFEEYRWHEFRLHKWPESLKAFVDLFVKQDGESFGLLTILLLVCRLLTGEFLTLRIKTVAF
jgi:hypothetical protein